MIDLGAVPTAPGCARAWARQVLCEWRQADRSEEAVVIVSELTTNAVLASRREGRSFIRLILTSDEGDLAILVRDYCSGAPQRGLLLVEAMSAKSGWYPADDGTPGKVVWAIVRRGLQRVEKLVRVRAGPRHASSPALRSRIRRADECPKMRPASRVQAEARAMASTTAGEGTILRPCSSRA